MSYSPISNFAGLPRTTRGVPIVLGGDPKGKNFLYTNANNVIIRDIANPSICDVYTEHAHQTTVAKYSPSGFYIASADNTGKVRIWDTTQKEHLLKNEYQPFYGVVKDLAWSPDSQKIVVAGEGREKFGHVFSADTGTSVGEIMGQSRPLNSVDYRPARPFRIVTASEDNSIAFHHGPPFKFQFTKEDHNRFVNSVRYSPNGELFASGGADGKCFLYEGTSGEKKAEFGSPAHKMGIYGVCFSGDSSQLLTVSADKTAKIWDCSTCSVVQEFKMGDDLLDMQVGCLWQGDYILSVALSGFIHYLDKSNPNKPLRTIRGHNKPITALCVKDKNSAFTASFDGSICLWDMGSGECHQLPGKGHSNQVQDMKVTETEVVSCGMDDHVMISQLDGIEKTAYQKKLKLNSQPKRMAVSKSGHVFVATAKEIVVLQGDKVQYSKQVSYEPNAIAVRPDGEEVAVGGGDEDKAVHVYQLSGAQLGEEKHKQQQHGAVVDLAYSPDGRYLASCDAFRKVVLYSVPAYETLVSSEWGYHTARVNSLDWTSDSNHVASGALDTNCIVWKPQATNDYVVLKGAHQNSQVTRVAWLDDTTLVSTGQDCCLKQWKVSHQ